jgi:cob(I)alamin adenosyltransferase
VLIFTGEGKGKTTAALGMAFRATGHNMRVGIVQFIKNDESVGEVFAARSNPMIEMHVLGMGFIPPRDDPRLLSHRAAAQDALKKAAELIASGRFALVILDEICLAAARGLIEEEQVVELVAAAPAEMCLVLTGRYASDRLLELADTATEMRPIKHGFDAGIMAQKGVEH